LRKRGVTVIPEFYDYLIISEIEKLIGKAGENRLVRKKPQHQEKERKW